MTSRKYNDHFDDGYESEDNDNLFVVIEQNDHNTLRHMLQDGYSPHILNSNGDTILKFTLSLGRARCLKILLNYGISPNKSETDRYFDPLRYTIFDIKNPQCMDLLLYYGAYTNDSSKKTKLLFEIDNIECLAVIIKYMDINTYQDDIKNHITLLHKYTIENNLEMVRFLLRHGANPNIKDYYYYDNENGYTPLYFACQNNSLDMIALLLEYGADKDLRNGNEEKLCYDYRGVTDATRQHVIDYNSDIKEPGIY